MYLCVRGYQAMTESFHVFVCYEVEAMIESGHVCVCYGVPIHDREWSCICVLGGTNP